MLATDIHAVFSVARLAARIRRQTLREPLAVEACAGGPDAMKLARDLARRYALVYARRLAARGGADCTAITAAAGRVREAVGHALLAVAAPRCPGAVVRLWDEVRGEVAAAVGGFARVLARGLGLTAEDAAQDGFVKFLTALPGYDPRRATFRTYFRRIARHHVLDLARRARVRPGAAGLDAAGDPPDTRHPDPAEAVAGGAWGRAVGEAVADVCGRLLADGHDAVRVEAFRLRRLGGLGLAEVAARVGRCVAWVYRSDLTIARAFADGFRARYPGFVRELAPRASFWPIHLFSADTGGVVAETK